MQTMTRTRRPFRAAITENGLVPTKRCEVLAHHGYYFGGSSSPSFVLVLAVTDDYVTYCDAYRLESRREQRWIFEDLATTAGATMRKAADQAAVNAKGADISTAMGRLAVQIANVTADRVSAHGAPVVLADYDKVDLRVSAPKGVDVYGLAKNWGCVGHWNDDANEINVECDRASIARLAESGLSILSERLVKACPRG